MDFTDKLACSGPAPVFSPDRKLLASADGYRLVVRAADSLAVVCLASCLDRIESLAWSPDSDHILCGLFRRATVQVFCVSDPDWACSIAEGPAGVTAARWTPDGRHILLTADFNLRLSVWSLVDQACVYLRGPKHAAAGLQFSPDGDALAVLHVRFRGVGREGRAHADGRRRRQLFSAARLTCPRCPVAPSPSAALRLQGLAGRLRLRHLAAARSVGAAHRRRRRPGVGARRRLPGGVGQRAVRPPGRRVHAPGARAASPRCSGACVHPLRRCASAVWRLPRRAGACPRPGQGECLAAFSAYKECLGIKAVAWSPSGQLLALGDYEQVGRWPHGQPRGVCHVCGGQQAPAGATGTCRHACLRTPPSPPCRPHPAAANLPHTPPCSSARAGCGGAQPRDVEPAGALPARAHHQRDAQRGGLQRGCGGCGAPAAGGELAACCAGLRGSCSGCGCSDGSGVVSSGCDRCRAAPPACAPHRRMRSSWARSEGRCRGRGRGPARGPALAPDPPSRSSPAHAPARPSSRRSRRGSGQTLCSRWAVGAVAAAPLFRPPPSQPCLCLCRHRPPLL